MITKDNPSMDSTAESIYLSNSDFVIRERCRAREDAIIHEKFLNDQLAALTSENSALSSEVNSLTSENSALSSENSALSNENVRLRKLLEKHGIQIE